MHPRLSRLFQKEGSWHKLVVLSPLWFNGGTHQISNFTHAYALNGYLFMVYLEEDKVGYGNLVYFNDIGLLDCLNLLKN